VSNLAGPGLNYDTGNLRRLARRYRSPSPKGVLRDVLGSLDVGKITAAIACCLPRGIIAGLSSISSAKLSAPGSTFPAMTIGHALGGSNGSTSLRSGSTSQLLPADWQSFSRPALPIGAGLLYLVPRRIGGLIEATDPPSTAKSRFGHSDDLN